MSWYRLQPWRDLCNGARSASAVCMCLCTDLAGCFCAHCSCKVSPADLLSTYSILHRVAARAKLGHLWHQRPCRCHNALSSTLYHGNVHYKKGRINSTQLSGRDQVTHKTRRQEEHSVLLIKIQWRKRWNAESRPGLVLKLLRHCLTWLKVLLLG